MAIENTKNWTIQTWTPVFAKQAVELFTHSVHAIKHDLYPQEAKHAWAPLNYDLEYWKSRLNQTQPFLCVHRNQLIGFIELLSIPYIDCLYTDPAWQRQGVAQDLYEHAYALAKQRGDTELAVDASALAVPFFEKNGFHIVTENKIAMRGSLLTNWRMQKTI